MMVMVRLRMLMISMVMLIISMMLGMPSASAFALVANAQRLLNVHSLTCAPPSHPPLALHASTPLLPQPFCLSFFDAQLFDGFAQQFQLRTDSGRNHHHPSQEGARCSTPRPSTSSTPRPRRMTYNCTSGAAQVPAASEHKYNIYIYIYGARATRRT